MKINRFVCFFFNLNGMADMEGGMNAETYAKDLYFYAKAKGKYQEPLFFFQLLCTYIHTQTHAINYLN